MFTSYPARSLRSVATVPARTATPWGPTSGWAPTARAPLHLPFPRPAVVKEGRVVGCQARPERLNVYVVQMFGPDQAVRDKSGNRDWAKPFTWCVRHHTTGATAEHAHVPACLLACLPACVPCTCSARPAVGEGLQQPSHPAPLPDPPPSIHACACQAKHGIPGACRVPALGGKQHT